MQIQHLLTQSLNKFRELSDNKQKAEDDGAETWTYDKILDNRVTLSLTE